MPRGTLASTVLTMLKAEIGDYAGTNTIRDAELYQLMSNKQAELVLTYDWSFLVQMWDAPVAAQQQFVTWPTTDIDGLAAVINLDEINKLEVLYNQKYQPMLYGIGSAQYNTFNYVLLGQTSDPIMRWREASDPSDATNTNKFEVWPVPTTAQTVRVTAERQPTAITGGSIKVDLDDLLITLGVASDVLFYKNPQKAQLVNQRFQAHLRRLGGQSKTSDKTRILGDGEGEADFNRNRKLVAIAGNTH